MDFEEAKGTLVQEARDLLESMEAALLEIESEGPDADRINAVFRAAHTIKGSAGLFGLSLIVDFTHVMESVLVRLRNGEIGIDTNLTSLLLGCGDYLGKLIDQVEQGGELLEPDTHERAKLLSELTLHLDGQDKQPTSASSAATDVTSAMPCCRWNLSLRFSPDLLKQGMDPLSFLNYLERHAEILTITVNMEKLPTLADMDPEACYLGYDLMIESSASTETLLQAFDFIAEDSVIMLEPVLEATPVAEVASCAASQEDSKIPHATPPAEASSGATPQVERRQGERRASPDRGYIKIEANKLDQLIDAVGEMVILASGVRLIAERQDGALRESMAELEALVERIRDRALNLRMTPIGEVFQRFPRVVRDVSKQLGKKIELKVSGAEAELDKSMVDKLSDPLMHIVRNAMDHGIEPPAERLAAGKPEQGSLCLNAYHESGSIVVEIGDDGRGLNKERIRAKAMERGLIKEGTALSDGDIYALIFQPGFSTAEQVTDISGRGVGMDVVRQNIDRLHGTVEIESHPGQGSTFRIRLPLTLAIIDGFQVTLGDANFILPLDMVEECVDIQGIPETDHVIQLRGEALPYLDLASAFDLKREESSRRSLVVVRFGNRRAGILVDRFVGELQAVIKPLGCLFQGLRGLGGSTILGDGSVALILDVASLLTQCSARAANKQKSGYFPLDVLGSSTLSKLNPTQQNTNIV